MTNTRDVEGRISLWMEEEVAGSRFPDRLLGATFDQTRELRQARSRSRTFPVVRSWTSFAAAGAAAVVIVAAGILVLGNLVAERGPGDSPSAEPHTDSPSLPNPLPVDGLDREFIVFTPRGTGPGWDLGAQDPTTGAVRTLVATRGIIEGVDACFGADVCSTFIRKAEWSADRRWVAFEVSNASLDGPALGPCEPAIGIWVQGLDNRPRQLTTPCDAPPSGSDEPVRELWAWSPVSARLAYSRIDGETDDLFVIDPSDGSRTSLVAGELDAPYPVDSSALAWSPDGARLAYVDRSSVRVVDVDGGGRAKLADSFEDIVNIAWSPTGAQILVHDQGRYRIQVMNGDGSDLHPVLGGQDACCDTAWSPNGKRIVYMLSLPESEGTTGLWHSEVWTISPDASNPIKVFDSEGCGSGSMADTLPVWTPDGTQLAYNACGTWVIGNADGTGEIRAIDELVWRSWYSSGLTGQDLAGIGQIDH